MPLEDRPTRRAVLLRGRDAALGLGAVWLLAACGGGKKSESTLDLFAAQKVKTPRLDDDTRSLYLERLALVTSALDLLNPEVRDSMRPEHRKNFTQNYWDTIANNDTELARLGNSFYKDPDGGLIYRAEVVFSPKKLTELMPNTDPLISGLFPQESRFLLGIHQNQLEGSDSSVVYLDLVPNPKTKDNSDVPNIPLNLSARVIVMHTFFISPPVTSFALADDLVSNIKQAALPNGEALAFVVSNDGSMGAAITKK